LAWIVKVVERNCPTPVIAYNDHHLNSAGALMFTASHNFAPYCGIKYIPNYIPDYAGAAIRNITDTIVANIEGADDSPPVVRMGIKFIQLLLNPLIYSSCTPCWMVKKITLIWV
jgi:phosphomannomutase